MFRRTEPSRRILLQNWRAQLDEIVALHSIFGDDFRIVKGPDVLMDATRDQGSQNGELSSLPIPNAAWFIEVHVFVHLQIPAEGLDLHVVQDASVGGDVPGDKFCALDKKVRHLPPLLLRVRMGPAYPMLCSPMLRVLSTWLAPRQRDELCRQLMLSWRKASQGMAVCFAWADWLRHHGLQHMHVATDLLVQGCPAHNTPDSLAAMLIAYNAKREGEAFTSAFWRCGICLEELPGSSCARLPTCGHFYCCACLRQYCCSVLEAGSVERLLCPHPGCSQALPQAILKQVLSAEEFKRVEGLQLASALAVARDTDWCPRCHTCCPGQTDDLGVCPRCRYTFCRRCKGSWHPGSCESLEEVARRVNNSEAAASEAAAQLQPREVEELLSLLLVARSSRRCPHCRAAISKQAGCNKVACTRCGTRMCFLCGSRILGYDHYQQGACQGRLFEETGPALERLEAVLRNGRPALATTAPPAPPPGPVAMMPHRRRPPPWRARVVRPTVLPRGTCWCPRCGRQSCKTSTCNVVCCSYCHLHFCFLCNNWLRPGAIAAHYRQTSCLQHSSD